MDSQNYEVPPRVLDDPTRPGYWWARRARSGTWVEVAHAASKPCHVGRVGTPDRVLWARAIGADSIDSALPLRSCDQLEAFLAAVRGEQPARAQLAMGF